MTTTSATPLSTTVGTSGSDGQRSALETTIGRSLPDLTSAVPPATEAMPIGM